MKIIYTYKGTSHEVDKSTIKLNTKDKVCEDYIEITADSPLQEKTVSENGEVTPDSGYDGLSKVTVNVQPSLTNLTATENGTYTHSGYYGYDTVTVNIQHPLQDKTATDNGVYTADEGYYGIGTMTVSVPEWDGTPSKELSIVNTLTHVTTDNTSQSIIEGSSYTANLTVDTNYHMFEISVVMGGVDVTDTVYSEGAINISSVTGHLSIYAYATSEEYTRLDYIKSTGTQYINTGILPTRTSKIETKVIHPDGGTSLFGAANSSSDKLEMIRNSTGSYSFVVFGSESVESEVLPISGITNVLCDIKNLRGEVNAKSVTLTDLGGAEISYPVFLSATNNGGVIENISKLVICYFRHYKNDILIQDLVPALRSSDNKPGLYDYVSDTFYTNAGTGEFLYG